MKRWVLLVLSLALGQMCWPSSSVGVADLAISGPPGAKRARVVIVQGTDAIVAFNTREEVVRPMVNCGLTNLTGKTSVKAAWLSLVSTQDVIGIKVFASPGAISGTRPAVVSGVVQGLLEAGVPREKIIIWDKRIVDLRLSGFMDLAKRYGVSVAGAAEEGYDDATAYDTALIGRLVWGDHEFGKKGEGIGRKSFVSNLVAHRLTKIINVTPMLNHNIVGVSGTIYGLTMASVDNTLRFDGDPERLATAAPEIYALRAVGDRVVLSIVDALVCQYEGEEHGLLHYSTVLNQLRFSLDPVALDVLSIEEIDRQNQAANAAAPKRNLELYHNATLLELGVSDPRGIQVDTIRCPE